SAAYVPGSPAVLLVAPRTELLARALVAALPRPPRVEAALVPRWGYVHYLFPGLLTFAVMLAGLFGMGHAMVRFRENLFLKKLATTPLGKGTFVLAQVGARGVLVAAQMALLVLVGALGFGVPIGLVSAAWLAVVV